MSVKAAAEQTYQDLKQALAEGKIPPQVSETAIKLLGRLHQPVRVSVMGLPGSGKSTLINLLLSKIVMPEGVQLPTAQFLLGDTPKAICTLPDGKTQVVDGADPQEVSDLKPIFVEFQMPLPALGRISVLEVRAPDIPKEQQRAMHWAAKRTDIALWCTQEFSTLEQALWQSLPEPVKDHAIMLVTKADVLDQNGMMDRMISELRYTHAHQFNKIMHVATPDAIAARRADGTVDKPLLQKSGGLTLISTILRQVDRGLQATIDQCDLILHKYRDAAQNPDAARVVDKVATPRPVSRLVTDEPVEVEKPAESPVVVVETSRPVATGTSRPISVGIPSDEPTMAELTKLRRPEAPVAPKATAEEPKKPRPGFMPKAKATEVPRAKPETCAAYGEAIAYLSAQGRALTAKLSSGEDVTSDALMSASADNITWLSEYLEDVAVTDDPVLEKSRTRALDASELIQLMQFEKNDDAGIEALSLVIQLKRDLEAEIAMSTHVAQTKAA